uniref:SXP/RAL-2 family protein Ani s 5-like cation-binding domain-containing protein n=1 Tax=Strongyloides stercoralis TaxID=6248 RepID=A0A0K0EFP5_STRER
MYLNKQNIFVIILCFLIIHPAADYIKQTAAPTIKNKTEELKTTLQDPDTYKGFKEWLNQVAIPTLKEKASAAGEYMKTEVLPELKKVYEAIKHNDTEGVSNN